MPTWKRRPTCDEFFLVLNAADAQCDVHLLAADEATSRPVSAWRQGLRRLAVTRCFGAVTAASLPCIAHASPVITQTIDLQDRMGSAGAPSSRQYPAVDEGLLLWDRDLYGDEVLPLEVYDWVDGELVGPFGLVGVEPGLRPSWVDRAGDRIVVARPQIPGGVEFYTWSAADQAFVLDTFFEFPDGRNSPYFVQLAGEHLLTLGAYGVVTMWRDGPAGWTEVDSFDDNMAGGRVYFEPPYLRYGTTDIDPFLDPATMVRHFDEATETWELVASHSYAFEPHIWSHSSFSDAGEHYVVEWPCGLHRFLPDSHAIVDLGPMDVFEGRACDDVAAHGTDRWVLGTTHGTNGFVVSIVHTGSPEPFVWDTLVGQGAAPFITGIGFLDDQHFVTYDDDSSTGPGDVGQVLVWEMTGPPVLQWLAPPTPDEGSSVPLDSSVYVMDPDHALPDVPLTLTVAPANGTLAVDGIQLALGASVDAQAWMDGRVTYDHDGSETTTDAFVVQGCDPDGACSDDLLVDVAITPVNDAPLPTDDTLTVPEGGEGLLDVLANDTDADSVLDLLGVSVAPPAVGAATVQTDGLRYAHDGSEPGADPVRLDLTVCDPEGACSPSSVAVTVTPVNDPPVATDDAATLDEGGTVVVDVLANDIDPDDALATDGTLTVLAGPVHGTATVDGATLEVQHDGAETTTDTVTYKACDAAGACSQAVLQLAVLPVNDTPTLAGDVLVVDQGSTATASPLANDADVDGTLDPATLSVATPPAHGTVTVDGEGLTYAHDGSETVSDAFSYTACDDGGACGEAAVEVVVRPVRSPEPTDPTDPTEPTDGLVADAGGDEKAGCGCASTGLTGWGVLVPLVVLVRRRS